MNTDAKIVKKIQHYIKIIICNDQMGFIPGIQKWVNIHK